MVIAIQLKCITKKKKKKRRVVVQSTVYLLYGGRSLRKLAVDCMKRVERQICHLREVSRFTGSLRYDILILPWKKIKHMHG